MRKNILQAQVGLILLVIMGVVVALVMSVASRSLSDTVISRQERESSAAFSVAETGVENAMSLLRQGSAQLDTQISFADTSGLVSGKYLVAPTSAYSLYVREGETAQLELTKPSGSLTIYWTKKNDVSENPQTCTEQSGGAPAALEIMGIWEDAVPIVVRHSYYNSSRCDFAATNKFASISVEADPYLSSMTLTPSPNATVWRIKPIYSGATISVSGLGKDQLYLVQSKGVGGDAQKEIEVKRGLDGPSSVFNFAIFSAGSIIKP